MILLSFGGLNLKIVYVVPVLAPYAIPRFQELAKIDGVEVHVIVEKATSKDRIGWKFEEIEGVTAHLVNKNYSHKFIKTNRNGNYTQDDEHIFSFNIRQTINCINPDIVLVCNSSQLLMLFGPRKYKLGVIVEDTLRANEGRKIFNKLIKRLLLKTADFYCAFSSDAVEYLKVYGIKEPIINTSWSIDNKDFSNMTKDEIIKFKLDNRIDINKKIFLIVANLIKLKGIIEFLNSWNSLPKEVFNNTELYIAGEGPERENIINFIIEHNLNNVKLLGHVDYNKIKKYLQSVDIFVLPTLEDLNSLSVFEAVAARRPLLISTFAGNCFLVEKGKNGFVFNPYNIEDTTSKIIKLCNSDLDMFSNESRRISELYTNKVVMENFYKNLAKL